MAKLVKTTIEVEGTTREELSIAEDKEPALWTAASLLRSVGNRQTRIDGPARVSGGALYTFDVQLPGMLYARVLRSPYPHARIKKIDTSAAESLPGVRAVLFYANTADAPPLNGVPIFERTLRYDGEDVAAVAADDELVAGDALDLIKVEYDELPFVIDAEEALKPGAPEVQPGGNLDGARRGSTGAGISRAVSPGPTKWWSEFTARRRCIIPAWKLTGRWRPGKATALQYGNRRNPFNGPERCWRNTSTCRRVMCA